MGLREGAAEELSRNRAMGTRRVKRINGYGGTEGESVWWCLRSGEGLAVSGLGGGELGRDGEGVRQSVQWTDGYGGLSRGSGIVLGVWGEPDRDRGEGQGSGVEDRQV